MRERRTDGPAPLRRVGWSCTARAPVRRPRTTYRCSLRHVLEADRARRPACRPSPRSALSHGVHRRSIACARAVGRIGRRARPCDPVEQCQPALHVLSFTGSAPVGKGAPRMDGVPGLPVRPLHAHVASQQFLTASPVGAGPRVAEARRHSRIDDGVRAESLRRHRQRIDGREEGEQTLGVDRFHEAVRASRVRALRGRGRTS